MVRVVIESLIIFSDKENGIMSSLRDGFIDKKIPRILKIIPNAVKSHFKCIFNKLGVQNHTQAFERSVCLGLPSEPIKA